MTGPNISLDAATEEDATLLSDLLEEYAEELSDVFPSMVRGPDGRFGYPRLPLYWSESERRFAFVIHVGGQAAGCVLATRGSPEAADPQVLDVAEFFVQRRFRRLGVGQRAAQLLWCRLPGMWTVRVAAGNRAGLAFWAAVLELAAAAEMTVSVRPRGPTSWQVYTFSTAVQRGAD